MDQCQASPRPELKENGPAYGMMSFSLLSTTASPPPHTSILPPPPPATIEVPADKRRKLIGSGGHRIRALVSDTGAEVRTVSDEQMSVFAPTREGMEDLMERVEAILQEEEEMEVSGVWLYRPAGLHVNTCTCIYFSDDN